MPCGSNYIFNYKTKDYEKILINSDETCESVCIYLSKKLNISPPTRLLFSLRIADTQNWLPPSHNLQPNIKYDFRIRFKVSQLTTLKKLDIATYDYFYHQVRYDLVNDKIPEIKYPAYKDNVLGLGVVDMYIDMIEKNYSIDDLEKNYKKYIPKELVKNHLYFAKRVIHKGLRDIKKKDHDIFYVKGTYLESIQSMAPNYLIEEFRGEADYLAEDDLQSGTCPVIIQFNPYHEEQPGLRVYYNYKKEWKHVLRLENIYALYREGDDVRFELSDRPNGFKLCFHEIPELESFVTYVAGYYRLSVKWILDLCVEYLTPSLQELKELKYHGPIGGEFSYAKIREKNNKEGSYIVRQCEKNYDTYFVDINTKGSHTETFKITRDCQQWVLHIQECQRRFHKLTELVLSIDTKSAQKFRIPPSEYDKPPLLLISLPRNQVTTKKTVSNLSEADLHQNRVQIIDPKKDLQLYKKTQKDCEGGRIIQMRADWILSGDTKISVTLKILRTDRDFTEFIQLANRWSKMYSSEFLKLYGITLSTPHTLVMEHAPFGPLNKFLRGRSTRVPMLCLLEAVHALVRAVVYMQENNLIHAYIRCSNIQVIQYNEAKNTLVVKLADPGFHKPYKTEDMPWIPINYYEHPERAKEDISAELWAFSTTVWEIFSRCKILQCTKEDLMKSYYTNNQILPVPCEKCPPQILAIIKDGWNSDPDKRFSQQNIFALLSSTKQAYSHSSEYSRPNACTTSSSSETSSLRSDIDSVFTDDTMLNGQSDSERSGNYSDMSINGDTIPILAKTTNTSRTKPHLQQSYFDETPSVVKLKTGKVIYNKSIGEGHYGSVYLGEMHFYNKNLQPKQVAIKTLKNPERQLMQDFRREITIMQSLNHPNIVKILDHFDDPMSLSIIMEYVECGSFNTYLSSNKPRLTNESLLRFAYDIAKGMDYLRSKNVIHRDLAARNILVDSECVKISDFGLAQIADSNGYYFVQSDRHLPLMWYAIESLKTHKFSFQSDVWSYGVTLFEMFSRGERPEFCPTTDRKPVVAEVIINKLDRGERLYRHELCPENIYNELMLPCWHSDPKSRPHFRELMGTIEVILGESGECI